ncbi:MAG: hypothetical protein RR877_10430, partial [Aurantimicrobium sp.]|uniref:hypothetical protein n=1 Tax=Aurantimicrobium sp. TaxID=1930784 RepID=UPI002FC87F75
RAGGATFPGIKLAAQDFGGVRTTLVALTADSSAFSELHQQATGYIWRNSFGNESARLSDRGNFFNTGRHYIVEGDAVAPFPTARAVGLQFLSSAGHGRLFAYNYSLNVNTAMVYEADGHYFEVGPIISAAGFGPSSDPKLKDSKTFRSVDNAVEKLYNLNVTYGKYHDWYNPDGKERVFLMADNAMKQYIPQAFLEGQVEKEGEKYNAWAADQVIALCVKAIQELTDKVNNLEEQLNEQQSL